ncbi:MAG: hypothetical protein AABX04_06070 [Nanoarchaeota archaeon]
MTDIRIIENISGNLRAYAQLEEKTFQRSRDVTKERITNSDLCQVWLYTADGNAYQSGKGSQVLWGLTGEEDNLILTHLFDAENSSYDQLETIGNFRPEQVESDAAFRNAEVMDLSQFRLQGNDSTYRSLRIRTADGYVWDGNNFVPANGEEKKGLNGIGFTGEYLTFLNDNRVRKIAETNLHVLNPTYVQREARGGTLWQASWLNDFGGSSSFNANDRDVDGKYRLRGVRRMVVVAGDAPKNVRNSSSQYHHQKFLVRRPLEDFKKTLEEVGYKVSDNVYHVEEFTVVVRGWDQAEGMMSSLELTCSKERTGLVEELMSERFGLRGDLKILVRPEDFKNSLGKARKDGKEL